MSSSTTKTPPGMWTATPPPQDGSGGERVCAARTMAQWRFVGTVLWLLVLVALGYLLYRMAIAPRFRNVSVSGEGRVKAAPNIAYVTVGVQTEAESNGAAAAQQNAQRLQQVLQAVGPPSAAQEIETLAYEVTPVRDRDGTVTMYRVSNRARVTLRGPSAASSSRLSQLVDAASRAGANQIDNIYFDLDQDARHRLESQAQQQAVVDAEQKARLLANSAGASLGAVISLQEPGLGGGGNGGVVMAQRAFSSGPGTETDAAQATPVLAPQTIEVVRRIEATYQLQ